MAYVSEIAGSYLKFSLSILSEFQWIDWLLFSLKSSEYQSFLIISGEIEVNWFAEICIMLEVKFGNDS